MLLNTIKRSRSQDLSSLGTTFVISGLLFLAQCKSKTEEQSRQTVTIENNTVILTDAQLKNAPVETTRLSERNIASLLKLNGKIDVPPQNLLSVSIPLGGYLESTKLLPGMRVRKGETIAVMEDPQYVRLQQDYLQAKSKLRFASLDYERQRSLNQDQASSDKVMQQAESEVSNQRILMNALAQQLRLINIDLNKLNENTITKSVPVYSQINGFVSKVNVNIGKYVNPTDVLFELINPSDIHLNVKVYEKDISKLNTGQKLITYSNSEPGKKYEAEIILIGKDVGSDGIADVHCHFHQYDKNLIPGTYMNAEIEIGASSSYALPEESVVNFEGKDYVFVQTGTQQFKMIPVTTGEKESGFIQILNNTDFSGKSIAVKNAYTLLMQLKNTSGEE